MTRLEVGPATGGLHGTITVPGDKSISHRALLLAALAEGASTISGLSGGLDVVHTARAVAAFGAGVEPAPVAGRPGGAASAVVVHGGRDRLHEPAGVVDVGNSGTAIRLLAGWATGIPGMAVLAGDASVAARPMGRIAEPLRAMGARVDGRCGGTLPPLVVHGGGLLGIDYAPPVASAQVKGAVLLAGLAAAGETVVREAVPTRRHSEELLAHYGAALRQGEGWVAVRPGPLAPADLEVPADPSQAAFWAVAASIVPGSDVRLPGVYVGYGRAGFLDVLGRMGADITATPVDGRPHVVDLRVRAAPLRATGVGGAEVPGLIDEIPALAVAAAFADGTTTFADAAELRVKESDRIATTVAALRAIGVPGADPRDDGLVVTGQPVDGTGRCVAGGLVDAHGDHRIAMALAVAGLAAGGPVTIAGWDSVATSYPGFEEDLRACAS